MSRSFRIPIEIVAILAGITGVLLVLYAWHLPPFRTTVETTENAYVKGYVTTISPQLGGYIAEVKVRDYEAVKAGQVLVRIDDRIYAQRVAQAKAILASQKATLANSNQQELSAKAGILSSQAQLDSAKAGLKRAASAWDRADMLERKGIAATKDAEQAEAALDQAKAAAEQGAAALEVSRQSLATIIGNRAALEAAVNGAEAAVQLAEIDLQNTAIVAPQDGHLGEVGTRLGQYVAAGTQLMAIVPEDVWVIANFKETQLDGMKVGQPVKIIVDALERQEIAGHIERFSPAAGSEFAAIKPDNATGNFTKIAQRVGVRISIDSDQAIAATLSPGLSVVVSVDKADPSDTGTAVN